MLDNSRPTALSVPAAGRNQHSSSARSPTKSPSKTPSSSRPTCGLPLRQSVDDVGYRQIDSTRATDQVRLACQSDAVAPTEQVEDAAPSTDKQSQYMTLLSSAYSHTPGSRPTSTAAALSLKPSAIQTSADGSQSRTLAAASPSALAAAPPPLRTAASPKGANGLSSQSGSTPGMRRSTRPSILDTSQGASLIPASPEAATAGGGSRIIRAPTSLDTSNSSTHGQAVASPTAASKLRSSAGSVTAVGGLRALHTREPVSPVRRSAPAAQQRPQYAFGSRVESPAAAKRRPSPIHARQPSPPSAAASAVNPRTGSLTSSQVARSRAAASPQRVPSAVRSSPSTKAASPAALRSTSAPRMSIAEKPQSRFMQHAVTAAAAQRSKTPNPAQRAAAAAAAAAASSSSTGIQAARRLRQSASTSSCDTKRPTRIMRASDGVVSSSPQSRLISFSSPAGPRSPTRRIPGTAASASGKLQAGSRSVLAAAAHGGQRTQPVHASKASPARLSGGNVGERSGAARADRVALSLPATSSRPAEFDADSSQDCAAGVLVPVIKDRYKNLFKHTPAALAVEQARAAAAASAAAEGSATTGGRAPVGLAVPKLALSNISKLPPNEPLAAPRRPSPRAHEQQQQCTDSASSPFLGRMSGLAAASVPDVAAPAIQHHGSYSTPTPQRTQKMPLLALSGISPAHHKSELEAIQPSVGVGPVNGSDSVAAAGTGIQLTPCPAAAPCQDDTPSLLVKSLPRTGSSCKSAGAQQQPGSPQLLPKNLSASMQVTQDSDLTSTVCAEAAVTAAPGKVDVQQPSSQESAAVSTFMLCAKGDLPLLQLHSMSGTTSCESPPKHRRGDPDTPGGSAAPQAPLSLDLPGHQGGSNVSTSNAPGEVHAAARVPGGAPGEVHAVVGRVAAKPAAPQGIMMRSSPGSASKQHSSSAERPRPRVSAGTSVLEPTGPQQRSCKKAGNPLRRSQEALVFSPAASTPAQDRRALTGSLGGKATPQPSPSKKLGTPVPRLDLTPVLASVAAEQEAECDRGASGLLLLEDAPEPRRLELDADADEGHLHSGPQRGSGRGQACGSSGGKSQAGSGGGKHPTSSGKSQGAHNGKQGSGSGNHCSQQGPEQPPQESFYVYESVMPPEEQRTYEELRRVLLKGPSGAKHAANLQGIWGCYQDARRNTEAMAFRGHRLLDQVSTEYSGFKREAEVKMQELQEERDQAREELQLAMVAGSIPATSLQLAAKDKQLRELQEENSMLRQQVTEMEKALQMASDYHSATQAAHQEQQVPIHARVIAGSATASILTNQVLQQQYELQKVEKRMEDMKAALHLACGVLRQTNYMDEQSDIRSQLDADTLTVLDTIMATEEMEAGLAEAAATQQQQHMLDESAYTAAAPAVHIEEVCEAVVDVDSCGQLQA